MCCFSWNILFSINKNRVGNTEIEAGVVEGVVYSFNGRGVVVVSRGLFEATMIGLLAFALKYALCVSRPSCQRSWTDDDEGLFDDGKNKDVFIVGYTENATYNMMKWKMKKVSIYQK